MLIDEGRAELMVWGIAGGIALGCVIGGVLLVRKRPEWGATKPLLALLALIGIAAIASPITKFTSGTAVIRLRQPDGAVRAERLRLYGAEDYRFADGSSTSLAGGVKTIVINDRPAPAAIEEVSYGFGVNVEPTTPVAPFSAARLDELVRYVGPSDPPPETLGGGGTEHWVRW
jgi:hypothetical protein